MRIDGDHRVVRGAAAQCAGAWIEPAVIGRDEFRVALLLRIGRVMPHEVIPAHGRVLGGEPVESRHVVIERHAVQAWLGGVFTNQQPAVAAGLEQQDAAACLGQAGGHVTAART